jgi:PTS system mannose-specific IID component
MSSARKISLGTLLRVLGRSFFLQASWNFERLQNLGFLFVLGPALQRIYSGREWQRACRRHLEYFNTHPFLALPIVGASVRLEEKRGRGLDLLMDVGEFKAALMAPCAAMGDSLFWGGIRPVVAVIAVWFAFSQSLWALPVFLVLYNVPHVAFCIYGLLLGYRRGYRVVESLQRMRLPDVALRLKALMVVLLGAFCAWLVFRALEQGGQAPFWGILAVPAVLLAGTVVRRGFSALVLLFSLILVMWIGFRVCVILKL